MAQKIQFVAGEIRAAKASLEANLPTQIALFNAEPANTVALDPVAKVHFGITDNHAIYGFPQIEIAAVDGRSGNWAVERSEFDHDPTVNVVVWLEAMTGEVETVYEQLLGYIRCIIEVLSANDAFGVDVELAEEGAVYWRVTELIPVDMDADTREVRKWRAPGFVQFRLAKVERFV